MTGALPILLALFAFIVCMSLFSLFISALLRRATRPIWQQSLSYPPHPGYYSARENRRVYNLNERQPS